jgi:predicted permease
VESATFSAVPLLARTEWSETVQPDGGRDPKEAYFQAVRWNFFETLGIRTLSGRSLSRGDHARATPVAVINETMARQVFDDPHPVGRHFQLLTGPRRNTLLEVVGIVNDAKYSSLEESTPPTFYLPWAQLPPMAMTFEIRTAVEPSGLMPLVREVVKRAAPGVAVLNVKTQEQQIAETIAKPRALAAATGVFSVVGVLLACLGIYGVVSHDVTQRTREIGIRVALGARRVDVFRLVLTEVLVVTVTGGAIGVVLAVNATKLIASLRFAVSPADPVTLAAAVFVLTTAATLAAVRPAQRAARLNVTDALRHD